MPFIISKDGRDATLTISDKFSTPMQPGSFPAGKLKDAASVAVELDADFSNPTATIQTCNMLGRVAVTTLAIKSARGMAVVLATAAPVVTIAKGCEIEFGNLPKDANDSARKAILAKLAARFGESEAVIAAWFAQGKKLGEAGAKALFAKTEGLSAKALLGRDGGIDPEKVYARWNSPRSKAG